MPDAISRACALEGVASGLSSARDGIDAVLRDRGLRQITPEQTAAALFAGAVATAELEGDAVTGDDLATGGGGPTARAALRLAAEIPGLVPIWRRTPLQALARIHALAAEGSLPEDELGRPMTAAGRDRLAGAVGLYASATSAPALGAAAYLHAAIAGAAAFASHNGVVARAVERLILVERGLDPGCVLVPEVAHALRPDLYRGAVERFMDGDVHSWMLYATDTAPQFVSSSPLVGEVPSWVQPA